MPHRSLLVLLVAAIATLNVAVQGQTPAPPPLTYERVITSIRMPGCDGVMIHTEAGYWFAADSSPDTRPRTNPVARVESPPRFRVVVASGSVF
jgi:hypothetical protein